jgi:hypothetical protein
MFSLSKRVKTIDSGTIKFSILITIFALSFIVLGHFYPGQIQSVLKQPILKVPSAVLDWWSVTHIVFFAILAFLFPDYLLELFILGIFWEVVEDGLASRPNKGLIKCDKEYKNSWLNTFKVMWCDNIAREKDYWYGKWDDVFSNTLGLLIGHFIRSNNLLM